MLRPTQIFSNPCSNFWASIACTLSHQPSRWRKIWLNLLPEKKYALVDEIKFTLKSFSTLTILTIDEKLAEAAALVRARHGIRLPDALQVAAAIRGEATLFITNDKRLKKIDAFEVLVPSEFISR